MITFDEIMKTLFYHQTAWYIDMFGKIKSNKTTLFADRNNCTSKSQIDKWLCLNDLLNIAHYYNQQWVPDWENKDEKKFSIGVDDFLKSSFKVIEVSFDFSGFVVFKNREYAQETIAILGNEKLNKIFLQ